MRFPCSYVQNGLYLPSIDNIFLCIFCPGTMTTHAESINSDLQRGLDRRLRHTTMNTEQNQLAIKVSADN